MTRHPGRPAGFPVTLGGRGRDGDHRNALVGADHRSQSPGRLSAVHVGHVDVHQHDVETLMGQALEAFLGRRRRFGHDAQRGQHQGDGLAVDGMVVDDQHARLDRLGRRGLYGGLARRQGQLEGKDSALARSAGRQQIAAHQAGEFAADSQTQSRAAVLARRAGVQLIKRREQPVHLLGRHARPGVGDRHLDSVAAIGGRLCGQSQGDRAIRRELQRVGNEVVQHLTQTGGIALNPLGQAARALDTQAQALVARLGPPHPQGFADDGAQIEIDAFDLHPPDLDLGQVEQIVEQATHHLPGALDQARLGAPLSRRCAFQIGGAGENGADRGAQFVTDHGQIGRLGFHGGLGFGPAALCLFIGLALGAARLLGADPGADDVEHDQADGDHHGGQQRTGHAAVVQHRHGEQIQAIGRR